MIIYVEFNLAPDEKPQHLEAEATDYLKSLIFWFEYVLEWMGEMHYECSTFESMNNGCEAFVRYCTILQATGKPW